MWKQVWPTGPTSFEELHIWKIYCRVYDDIGVPTPGRWIVQWLQDKTYTEDIYDVHYNRYMVEAIRYYTFECHE